MTRPREALIPALSAAYFAVLGLEQIADRKREPASRRAATTGRCRRSSGCRRRSARPYPAVERRRGSRASRASSAARLAVQMMIDTSICGSVLPQRCAVAIAGPASQGAPCGLKEVNIALPSVCSIRDEEVSQPEPRMIRHGSASAGNALAARPIAMTRRRMVVNALPGR